MANKMEKERSALLGGGGSASGRDESSSGMRQNLVKSNSARKFIIVPAAIATDTASSSTKAPGNSGSGPLPGEESLPNESENLSGQPGLMGRSLKFHSMRSVRGK